MKCAHCGYDTGPGFHSCHRALEARIAQLKAALRKIVSDGDYTAPEGMKRIAREALGLTAETGTEPNMSPSRSHSSHKIRFSDASTFDEICEWCGLTDATPAGTYGLSVQCLGQKTKGEQT